jgi:hypothetical protein
MGVGLLLAKARASETASDPSSKQPFSLREKCCHPKRTQFMGYYENLGEPIILILRSFMRAISFSFGGVGPFLFGQINRKEKV